MYKIKWTSGQRTGSRNPKVCGWSYQSFSLQSHDDQTFYSKQLVFLHHKIFLVGDTLTKMGYYLIPWAPTTYAFRLGLLVLAHLQTVRLLTRVTVTTVGASWGMDLLWAKGTAKLIKGQNRQLDCSNLNKLWLQWLAPPELLSLSQCSPQETRTCWEMGLWEGKHRLV